MTYLNPNFFIQKNKSFDETSIKIKKSPSADSRTVTKPITKEELLEASKMHIEDVRQALQYFVYRLIKAGMDHDHTKISDIDDFYDSFSKNLKGEEFKKEKWFQTHLTERHHLNDRCPDDVNLIDVLERIADIVTAGLARSGKVYSDDLDPEILVKAYANTIELLKSKIEVID